MMRLKESEYGLYIIEEVEIGDYRQHSTMPDMIEADIIPTGRDFLVQIDFDRCGIASDFGWVPCPFCSSTDGTVDCKHRKVGAMIQSATNFLDDNIGNIAEDPGYFDE